MKILFKYPTKFRLNICLAQIEKYINLANDMENIQFIISIDEDDAEMIANRDKILSIHKNINIYTGEPNGKVDAINRDIPNPSTFDILVLISDDMIPIVKGYDEIIRNKMISCYPDTDGVLFFNDGYLGPKLNTIFICGSKYYQRFNYIYCPEYKSLWCDNEFMNVANSLKKQTYINDVIIKHEHPVWNQLVDYDELYKINESYNNVDKEMYFSRNPPLYDVTIMICTIPSRQTMFDKLMQRIKRLIENSSIKIEIVTDCSTDISIGIKRTLLLSRALGKYSCFIDDDDDITDEYFKIYEDVIASGIDYDCASLNGIYYVDGVEIKPFYHSIDNNSWFETEKAYYRFPNHLNLIKTKISRNIYFNDLNHGEDFYFSQNLFNRKILKKEYKQDKIQYLYYKITTQGQTQLDLQAQEPLNEPLKEPAQTGIKNPSRKIPSLIKYLK